MQTFLNAYVIIALLMFPWDLNALLKYFILTIVLEILESIMMLWNSKGNKLYWILWDGLEYKGKDVGVDPSNTGKANMSLIGDPIQGPEGLMS